MHQCFTIVGIALQALGFYERVDTPRCASCPLERTHLKWRLRLIDLFVWRHIKLFGVLSLFGLLQPSVSVIGGVLLQLSSLRC